MIFELTFFVTTIFSFVYFGWFGLIVLVTSLFLLANRYGVFTPIHFYRSVFPESHLLFIESQGDYMTDCPIVFQRILTDFNISCGVGDRSPFGIYYDNPNLTPKGKCRYVAGVLIRNGSFSKEELSEKLNKGYKERKLGFDCVQSVLPYYNYISLIISLKSYYSAFLKDVPALFKKFDVPEKALMFFLEVYSGNTVEFNFPIGNDEASFYLHSDVRRQKEKELN